jgi:hypothetical protein
MPHDPNDPITITGGSLHVELPMLAMRTTTTLKDNHMAFTGHTENDRITKIVVRNADGSEIFFMKDNSSGAEKCTIEIFFSHPPDAKNPTAVVTPPDGG